MTSGIDGEFEDLYEDDNDGGCLVCGAACFDSLAEYCSEACAEDDRGMFDDEIDDTEEEEDEEGLT